MSRQLCLGPPEPLCHPGSLAFHLCPGLLLCLLHLCQLSPGVISLTSTMVFPPSTPLARGSSVSSTLVSPSIISSGVLPSANSVSFSRAASFLLRCSLRGSYCYGYGLLVVVVFSVPVLLPCLVPISLVSVLVISCLGYLSVSVCLVNLPIIYCVNCVKSVKHNIFDCNENMSSDF